MIKSTFKNTGDFLDFVQAVEIGKYRFTFFGEWDNPKTRCKQLFAFKFSYEKLPYLVEKRLHEVPMPNGEMFWDIVAKIRVGDSYRKNMFKYKAQYYAVNSALEYVHGKCIHCSGSGLYCMLRKESICSLQICENFKKKQGLAERGAK